MFNLVELLSKAVPLPHIPSSWQIAPKVDKWIFLTLIWSFQTCEVPGPNSDGRIWNEQQMAGIDEERKMTKLSRAGEAVIINHAFDFRGERSSKTRANICSLHTLTRSNALIRMYAHVYFKTWLQSVPKNLFWICLFFILFILIKAKSARINILPKHMGASAACFIKDLIQSLCAAVPLSPIETSASYSLCCFHSCSLQKRCVLFSSLRFSATTLYF